MCPWLCLFVHFSKFCVSHSLKYDLLFVSGRSEPHEFRRDAAREQQIRAGGGGVPGGVAAKTGRRHDPDQPAEAVRPHGQAAARVVKH